MFVENYGAAEFISLRFQVTDNGEVVLVEGARAPVGLVVGVALFVEQKGKFGACLERLRIRRKERLVIPAAAIIDRCEPNLSIRWT